MPLEVVADVLDQKNQGVLGRCIERAKRNLKERESRTEQGHIVVAWDAFRKETRGDRLTTHLLALSAVYSIDRP